MLYAPFLKYSAMKKMLPFLLILLYSCSQPAPDLEKERQAILKIEEMQRDYHFKKNATLFSNILSDSFLSVSKGNISTPTRKETAERFSGYFNRVDFIKWDDVRPPVIRFSNDGSVAYVTVEKEVIVKEAAVVDTTHFAWVSIYKKGPSGWQIDCVASTNK